MLVRVERAGICGSDVQGVATQKPAPSAAADHGARAHRRGDRLRRREPEALVGRRVAVNPQVPCGLLPRAAAPGHENICQHRELVGGNTARWVRRVRRGAGALRSRHRRRAGRRRRGAGRAGRHVHPCVSAQPARASRNRGRARRRDDRDAGLRRRAPPRRRADRRQRAERGTPRLGPARRGRGGASRRALGQAARRPRARAQRSSSTPSGPTRRGPPRSRCCSRAAARSGSACTTRRPRSRRSTWSSASSRSADRSPTPTPTSRAAVDAARPSIQKRSASRREHARSRKEPSCSTELVAGEMDGFVKASLMPTGRPAMRFDLLIRGGEVVDPGGGHEGRLDVAIERDRIAAVDQDISAGVGVPRDRRRRADRHAGPGRPAHARVPQGDLLGHRPRPCGLAHRRDDVERRRLGRRADAAGAPRLRRSARRRWESRPSSTSRASASSATTTSAPTRTTSTSTCSAASSTATATSCAA